MFSIFQELIYDDFSSFLIDANNHAPMKKAGNVHTNGLMLIQYKNIMEEIENGLGSWFN